MLIAALAVSYIASITVYEDVDGAKYYIKHKKSVYALYDSQNKKVDVEGEYGYYVTLAGTLIQIDEETGLYEVIAVVDTEGTEQVGINNRVVIFPTIEKKALRSLEVHNEHGSFKFLRYNKTTGQPDDTGDFIIESSPGTVYDSEMFTRLYSSAGYTLSTNRIESPIKDQNGQFSEYGLVAEDRVNEDGEVYRYEPAYYIITDTKGTSHKVIVGDELVNGTGYYVQYVDISAETEAKRDAVYVLDTTVGETILQPVEIFVTPTIVYPMEADNYFDVEKFTVLQHDGKGAADVIASFTYIDLEERENTIASSTPYVFENESLDGYVPSADNISIALNYLYKTEFQGVTKLSPTEKDLIDYGFARITTDEKGEEVLFIDPKYSISFYFDILDDNGVKQRTIRQEITISEKNEKGNYFVYTLVYEGFPGTGKDEELLYTYDMIVEVKGHCLDFVTWKQEKWVNKYSVSLNIAFCEEITVKTPDYEAIFKLDNSATDTSQGISSSKIVIHGKDSKGNDLKTFSSLTKTDVNGYTWTVTESDVTVVDRNGETVDIADDSWYYAYNSVGKRVLVLAGHINCTDGSLLRVTADSVTLTKDGNTTTYVRFATDLFRKFYQTLAFTTLEDKYEISEEEEQALIGDPSKWVLTMTMKDTEGKVNTYEFYYLTTRKAYIRVNGNGGFYVLLDRANKIASDAQKFFALEEIDPTAKT